MSAISSDASGVTECTCICLALDRVNTKVGCIVS